MQLRAVVIHLGDDAGLLAAADGAVTHGPRSAVLQVGVLEQHVVLRWVVDVDGFANRLPLTGSHWADLPLLVTARGSGLISFAPDAGLIRFAPAVAAAAASAMATTMFFMARLAWTGKGFARKRRGTERSDPNDQCGSLWLSARRRYRELGPPLPTG